MRVREKALGAMSDCVLFGVLAVLYAHRTRKASHQLPLRRFTRRLKKGYYRRQYSRRALWIRFQQQE